MIFLTAFTCPMVLTQIAEGETEPFAIVTQNGNDFGWDKEGSLLSILSTYTQSQIPYTIMVYNGGHQFTVSRPAYVDFILFIRS